MKFPLPAIALVLPLGCPLPQPGDEFTDDEIGTDTTTDTTEDDTTDDTTDGGDTTDETTETGEPEMVWNVYNAEDEFVGRLLSPAPELFVDHDDMFSEPEPRIAHLTNPDGFGFLLNFSDPSFIPVAHDDVRFTGPGCTGTAIDYFASPLSEDGSIPLADCNDASIEAMMDEIQLHYGPHDSASDYVATNWPGAVGLVIAREPAAKWYHLPIDQPWPSQQTALSTHPTNGGPCEELPASEFVCAVELLETDWEPAFGGGPFRLVEEPAP
jgi:hypothetical protein